MKRTLMKATVGILVVGGWAGVALADTFVAPINFSSAADYDNTPNTVTAGPSYNNIATGGKFRDVFWWSDRPAGPGVGSPDYINRGNSLVTSGNHAVFGPGPYTALNFTGNSPSGGQSYMSVYDTTPQNNAQQNTFSAIGGLKVSADVLFAPGQHATSAGVVALYNEGQDALALLAHNGGGGNNDVPKVDLIFQSPGQGTVLETVILAGGAAFVGATWYRVTLDVNVVGDTWTVNGTFQNHQTGTDPTSPLALGSPIATLFKTGSVSDPDAAALHLTNPGEVGVIAQANEAFGDAIPDPLNPTVDNVGVSITNFQVATPVPLPSAAWAGLVLLGGLGFSRIRKSRV